MAPTKQTTNDDNQVPGPDAFSLSSLSQQKKDCYEKFFVDNIHNIFRYNADDVKAALVKEEVELLSKVRDSLSAKLIEMFPAYQGKKLGGRKEKHTFAGDIIILGISLTNNSPMKDLEKIYSPNKSTQLPQSGEAGAENNESAMQSLLKTVGDLQTKVDTLQKDRDACVKDIDRLKKANAELTVETNALKVAFYKGAGSHQEHGLGSNGDFTDPPPLESDPEEEEGTVVKITDIEYISGYDSGDEDDKKSPEVPPAPKKQKKKKKSTALKGAKQSKPADAQNNGKYVFMYFGGIDPSNTKEDLQLSLSEEGIQAKQVIPLVKRENSQSFKVLIKETDVGKSVNLEWPEGVRVNIFASKKSGEGSQAASAKPTPEKKHAPIKAAKHQTNTKPATPNSAEAHVPNGVPSTNGPGNPVQPVYQPFPTPLVPKGMPSNSGPGNPVQPVYQPFPNPPAPYQGLYPGWGWQAPPWSQMQGGWYQH